MQWTEYQCGFDWLFFIHLFLDGSVVAKRNVSRIYGNQTMFN